MKNSILLLALVIAINFGFQNHSFSQISSHELPPSKINGIFNENFNSISVDVPDVERLLKEDAFTDKYGIAMRFAQSVETDIDLIKKGTWLKLNDGSRICRLAINAPGAQAIILYYEKFQIPGGGKLFLYSKAKDQFTGAFTDFNNRNGGSFATEMIRGETTILEYHQPAGQTKLPEILIDEIGYVYRTAERIFGPKGFGNSDTCEVNVKCPEGTIWQDQANGVVRIIVKQGSSSVWCSGSLVNNTRLDHKPYLLSADHCGPNASPEDYDSWIFYFRYQSFDCENPEADTAFNFYTMIGASKKAAAGGAGVESDFKLLLLNENVPLDYDPYYNGWSSLNEGSSTGVTIHHPQGDIKKISTYTSPLMSTNWGSIPNTHWRVVWSATQTNWGVTEGGSSGSPIFNDQGLIVGQLTGGEASCNNLTGPDYYGKFSHSWDQIGDTDATKLKPWLDPENTGIEVLGGLVSTVEIFHPDGKFKLFPNPTSGLVFIEFDQSTHGNIQALEVMDMTGRMVYRKPMSSGFNMPIELNIDMLEEGIYFVTIKTDSGKTLTQKVIR